MKKLHILFTLLSLLPAYLPAATSPVDSLRRLAATRQGHDKHLTLARIAMTTNAVADWDSVIANARTRHDTASICMGMTNRFLCLSNYHSVDDLETEIPQALTFMRRSHQYLYFFHTYKAYIEALFRAKRYEDAQRAASAMFDAAREENQPNGMTIALNVQGIMYYKLGLYAKAMQTLEEAFNQCPSYKERENHTVLTSSQTCEWLCMTALKLNDHEKLALYADRYNDIVDYRDEIQLDKSGGHFSVTAAALRAQALLRAGKMQEARTLLHQAATLMQPGIPARAYEHYYEALCTLHSMEGDYPGALAAADTLLSTHKDYFPFYLDDMLRKAEILTHLGRGVESTRLYSRYIAVKDSIERIEIATQMDKLQTLYEVDRLKAEKKHSFLWFLIAAGGCTLLLIIFTGYIIYSHRLHGKNRILYRRIMEQEKMEERVLDAIEVLPLESLSKEDQLFCRLSEKMHGERLFTNPNLKRKDIAELLETNETYLSKAIRSNTEGKSYHEYVTDLRLKYASKLLTEHYEHTVTEIGERSGFNSPSTFFRVFRERFGMSPSDFRGISKEK